MQEKENKHEDTLDELYQAMSHIDKASDLTSCGFCERDLMIAGLLVQNIITLLEELIEKNNTEKKEGKGKEKVV